jgi:hypothetical protein
VAPAGVPAIVCRTPNGRVGITAIAIGTATDVVRRGRAGSEAPNSQSVDSETDEGSIRSVLERARAIVAQFNSS